MNEDLVENTIKEILKQTIKFYELNKKEAEELEVAICNYDYEANEGIIITSKENIVNLFSEYNNNSEIKPTQQQVKALAKYIKETENFYTFDGFRIETEEVIRLILNEAKEEKIIQKSRIIKQNNEEYPYNLQILNSIDNGKNFSYAGIGKFFKTREEAEDYRNKLKDKGVIVEMTKPKKIENRKKGKEL